MFCLNGIYSIKYIKLVVDKLVFGAYNRQSVENTYRIWCGLTHEIV